LPNFHEYVVPPVEELVKLTVSGAVPDVVRGENVATGAAAADTVTVLLAVEVPLGPVAVRVTV